MDLKAKQTAKYALNESCVLCTPSVPPPFFFNLLENTFQKIIGEETKQLGFAGENEIKNESIKLKPLKYTFA